MFWKHLQPKQFAISETKLFTTSCKPGSHCFLPAALDVAEEHGRAGTCGCLRAGSADEPAGKRAELRGTSLHSVKICTSHVQRCCILLKTTHQQAPACPSPTSQGDTYHLAHCGREEQQPGQVSNGLLCVKAEHTASMLSDQECSSSCANLEFMHLGQCPTT